MVGNRRGFYRSINRRCTLPLIFKMSDITIPILSQEVLKNLSLSPPMASPYPTRYQIEEMFHNRDTPRLFNTYLADKPDITVVGQDFHMAGHYRSTQAFHDEIYGRLPAFLKEETIRTEVLRVIGGGESAWAAVESVCTAEAKSGE